MNIVPPRPADLDSDDPAARVGDRARIAHLLRDDGGARALREGDWLHGDDGVAPAGTPIKGHRGTPAAVLVGLVDRPAGTQVLLTQRSSHLKHHAGQISFPGGRVEDDDLDATATALRETEEEIGLTAEHIDILGQLAAYHTVTGFRVQPVVGWITPPEAYIPDPIEVDEVFEVPLPFVLDPRNHERHIAEHNGMLRRFYVLPFQDRYIWGATAGILVNFARLLTR